MIHCDSQNRTPRITDSVLQKRAASLRFAAFGQQPPIPTARALPRRKVGGPPRATSSASAADGIFSRQERLIGKPIGLIALRAEAKQRLPSFARALGDFVSLPRSIPAVCRTGALLATMLVSWGPPSGSPAEARASTFLPARPCSPRRASIARDQIGSPQPAGAPHRHPIQN